ncbi:hypothetical protein [Rossellomorea sp. LjRoot5]|uniref:hypothetical protein n=1 Tax=Rossellomorea sp. LjRoot5 TaxID=3342331 RepID=UPI003ECE9CF0
MSSEEYVKLYNKLEIISVGQFIEITGFNNDIFIGTVEEIDLEAKGFWLTLESKLDGMNEWVFPNMTFFYEIDIKKIRFL